MNKIIKSYESLIDSVDTGKREVVGIISTDSIDRDNEVVSPRGMKKKNYGGNPVVMVNHDYAQLPVGKALWVKAEAKRVLAKYVVAKTDRGDEILALIQQGILGAHSIGFISQYSSKPTTAEKNLNPDLERAKKIHREWELMEFSVVGIPCNPDAVVLAVSKGLACETLNFITAGTKNQSDKEGSQEAIVVSTKQDVSDEVYRLKFYESLLRRLR